MTTRSGAKYKEAPIVLVPKKDGTLRFCVDYRKLNSVSETDAYPMPRIDEMIDRLGKAKYITTLDLTRGYWQVPMCKADRPKTAFTTPFGLFQFCVMPFGLKGAPATFQRLMDKLLRGLESYAAAYLDDLIIYSTTWDLVSSPDPPHHAHFGKLEREKWKEGLVNGLTTSCSSAGMLAELIKT